MHRSNKRLKFIDAAGLSTLNGAKTLVTTLPRGKYDLFYKMDGTVELWRWNDELGEFDPGAVDFESLVRGDVASAGDSIAPGLASARSSFRRFCGEGGSRMAPAGDVLAGWLKHRRRPADSKPAGSSKPAMPSVLGDSRMSQGTRDGFRAAAAVRRNLAPVRTLAAKLDALRKDGFWK